MEAGKECKEEWKKECAQGRKGVESEEQRKGVDMKKRCLKCWLEVSISVWLIAFTCIKLLVKSKVCQFLMENVEKK